MSLPPLSELTDPSQLSQVLCTLFEPSAALRKLLVPAVISSIESRGPPESYMELVDTCAEVANQWTWDDKADFIAGHPMIGEVKGLSEHSAKEQGNTGFTRPVVLQRLAHLNAIYCAVFPGLRYIIFVNGRSRAAIVPELEALIGLPVSPQPLPDNFVNLNEPPLESADVAALSREKGGPAWMVECDRALGDVWLIGKARVTSAALSIA